MLVELAEWLSQYYSGFGVFQYLTLRAILGTLTALTIALWSGPWLIRHMVVRQIGQPIREDGPKSHFSKAGTPTMGGMLILVAVTVATLLWAKLDNGYIWTVLFVTLAYGAIGFMDDFLKLKYGNSKGLSAKAKYGAQSLAAICVAAYLYSSATIPAQTDLLIPILKDVSIPMGWMFPVLTYFVIVGTSNAVNLTDGLDGLAIMPAVMVAAALGVFAYVVGHAGFAEYLGFPFLPGTGELVVFGAAIVGAGLGFLWFNTYPAMIFMGDIGALSLGAALGTMAVIVRQEIVLVVMGGIFVLETVSVILQVASFKLTGKRIFRMAPIHHHFELKGWPEPRVIVRFWIITLMLVLVGLATLKLR